MSEKAHLNGAYYGPSIPPSRSYRRVGRGGDCGFCGCCGCCIFSLIIKLVVTAVVFIGLAVFIFWLIFRPTKVKFHVTEATLSEFNLDPNSTLLHFNLALNITIRNPNKKIGIYFDRIEARGFYEGQRFGSNTLAPFYQGKKTTRFINPALEGHQVVLLGADKVSKFNAEKNNGVFSIDVKLYMRVRFKLARIKTNRFKPRIECDLKVPLSSNGTSAGSFQTSKCEFDIHF